MPLKIDGGGQKLKKMKKYKIQICTGNQEAIFNL